MDHLFEGRKVGCSRFFVTHRFQDLDIILFFQLNLQFLLTEVFRKRWVIDFFLKF